MYFHLALVRWVINDTYPKYISRNQYGAGQGSCLAQLMWVLMSTVIYKMLDNILVKATLHHTDDIFAHEQNVDGFMDDALMIMTIPLMEKYTHPPQYPVEGRTLLAQAAE
jgi:hypothetical protein